MSIEKEAQHSKVITKYHKGVHERVQSINITKQHVSARYYELKYIKNCKNKKKKTKQKRTTEVLKIFQKGNQRLL